MKRALILDLDFTLIHLEFLADSIEIPGRTRSAWLAPQTIELLRQLQTKFDLVLATARSWDGTRWVSDGLKARGVLVTADVIEDGALWGEIGALQAMDTTFDVASWRVKIEACRVENWPLWEWQNDFQACLVARCADRENAAQLMEIFAGEIEPGLRLFRDGRKVYLLPKTADKWSALQKLLGEKAQHAAGVGDGDNDLCWLSQIAFPATFARAKTPLREAVAQKSGFITQKDGHDGIADILRETERRSL